MSMAGEWEEEEEELWARELTAFQCAEMQHLCLTVTWRRRRIYEVADFSQTYLNTWWTKTQFFVEKKRKGIQNLSESCVFLPAYVQYICICICPPKDRDIVLLPCGPQAIARLRSSFSILLVDKDC